MEPHDIADRPPSQAGRGLKAASRAEAAALLALGRMAASASNRWQGEIQIALQRVGIEMTTPETLIALRNLEAAGLVADIIELTDGGVVATLTPLALMELELSAGSEEPD